MRLVFIVIIELLPFCAATAQGARTINTIYGVLLERDSAESVIGAQVKLPGLGLSTKSDLEGNFKFVNLPPGIYSVIVSDSDLWESTHVDSIVVPREDRPLIFFLRERPICDGEAMALKDLAHGIVILRAPGMIGLPRGWDSTEERRIELKYGFMTYESGCTDFCFSEYNKVVDKYLDYRNGPGWRERYSREIEEYRNRKR